MKKINSFFTSCLAFILVSVPAAVSFAAVKDFKSLVNDVFIGSIIRPLVPFLVGLAVVVFIYGVLVLMFSEGGEKKEDGKKYMLWGIIGIFVMVSVWGLVSILTNTFKLDNSPIPIKIGP